MKTYNSLISKHLVLLGASLAIWFCTLASGHAQGMVFNFDSDSYTVVKGQSLSGTISISELNDARDAAYEYNEEGWPVTQYGFVTDWFVHQNYDAPANFYSTGSLPAVPAGDEEISWGVNDFSDNDFSITFPNNGSAGPDLTGSIAITAYDPYYVFGGGPSENDPYDYNVDDNPYYYYCDFNYADVAEDSTATVTLLNPNTVMSVGIVGSGTLVETVVQESTTIRISRADTYNTRTVHYTISGNAQSGTDYTAAFTGNGAYTVVISAGQDHVDIPISTITQSDPFQAPPKSLTITLNYDEIGSYQIGTSSATITFLNLATAVANGIDPGTAQLANPTLPPPGDSKIGGSKNGSFGTNAPTTNSAVTSLYAFINVQATSPYASLSGPTPGVFTLTRNGGTNAVTVNYTISGTAIPGSNYTALSSSVTFASNQISTNLLVNALTNLPVTSAQTVVLSLSGSTNYFVGYGSQAVVTLLPNSSLTNAVTNPAGRYWRGSGSDPTYWSQVVPLDYEKGTVYSNVNGNCSNLYAGLTSWTNQTLYHYNAASSLSQTNITNRIAFNNPIVAFGERTGGTGLYIGQPYQFGVYAGDPLHVPTNIVIQVFNRTNLSLAGTISVIPPNYSNSASMLSYATNGFQVTTNAFGLTTMLSDSPTLTWGASSLGAYVLNHTASSAATNYYYLVEVAGYPADGTNAMVISSNGVRAPSLLYTLEFETRPPWRSIFVDQPQFQGSPLPSFYAGMTVAELLTNTPPVTNSVSFAPSSATNLDDSPELRRHPVLDQFVASMNNDPIALANYVVNQIDLTDPMGYSDDGNVAEQSINFGGVSRGALATFLEKQGSPVEQCALLVYLLRQAGVPAVYEFAPRNGLQMLDARLNGILKFPVQGAFTEAGQLYTTNTMIAVNYPWVAAYIGTNWVHIFPWMKDYQVTEGFDLYNYMPTNYSSAYPWVQDFIYGKTNLLSLATNGDNTPSVIFPAFIKQTLLQNYPTLSVGNMGVEIVNRPHYYARWQDFPTPTWVTNTSTPIESLAATSITNVDPSLTNIFDTVNVTVYSVGNPTNSISTGTLRLTDLHDREFYIFQTNTSTTNVQLSLILMPFRTNVTTQFAFSNDSNLLSREVLTMNLKTNENQLSVRFQYQRNQALAATNPVDPTTVFLGFNAVQNISMERPLLRGDQAAICMDYGRVTPAMINLQAQPLLQEEAAVQANPSLSNSVSPDIYEGAVMSLAGMTYYEQVSAFDQVNQNLHKVDNLSSWAVGLSKLSPGRDSHGNLTNGTDPILPSLDMFFYETAEVGNGTVQPDSGQTLQLAEQNYNLISIANCSAEEHQTLNHYYQQTNAVSTVRLLQLAGTNIVALNFSNYIAQAATSYQGQQLQSWDAALWSSVAGALNGSPYTLAYVTPGPMTNSSYEGMGALILGWNQWQALITPTSLNGAFGTALPPFTVSSSNFLSFFFNNVDDPTISLTPPVADSQVAQNSIPDSDTSAYANQVQAGDFALTPTDLSWITAADQLFGLSTTGTTNQNFASALIFAQLNGDLGFPNNFGTGLSDQVSDPVHSVTGEFLVNETDLKLAGPFPLALQRNYSSQNLADNQFGPGWKLGIMPYLAVGTGATNIYAADMDGAVLAYVRTNSSTNVWMPTLAANPGLNNETTSGVGSLANRLRDRIVLTTNGSATNYTLYGADGSVRAFQVITFLSSYITNTRPYLLQWTDSQGNYYTFTYGTNALGNDFGQVDQILCNNGNYLDFNYDENGHIIEAYSGDGRHLYYDYDDYNDLVNVTLPDATTRSYIYQHGTQTVTNGTATYSSHLIVEEDKPDGRALQNAYDSQRRVTNQLSTAGQDLNLVRTASFIYSNNFVFTNAWTNTITGYTLIVDGLGNTNRFDYTNSLITKITDPLSHTIQQTWYPDNTNAPGYPRSVATRIDKRGLVTQYQYDTNGNVTNTTVTGDLLGMGHTNDVAVRSAIYNSNCLPVLMTDPVGNGVSNIYDSTFTFLPKEVIKLAGATAICTNFSIYTNASAVVTNGDLVETNSAFGLLTRYIRAYSSADAATNDLFYNGEGFVTNSVQYTGTADPAITNYLFYNERNELIQRTDAAARNYTFEYDDMGRRIASETFDVGQDSPMDWSSYYYDDNGELNWIDGPRFNPEDYIFYDYDGGGRKIQEIHWRSQGNPDGSGVSAVPGYGLYAATFYQYDTFGNLTQITDPLGNYKVQSFDAVGRMLKQIAYASNGVAMATNLFAYEPGGKVSATTNALGGVTTVIYNSRGQPESQTNADGSTNGWQYDLSGRVVEEIGRNGAFWGTAYDDANLRVTKIYTNGASALATNITRFDHRGNAVQNTDANGNLYTNLYDGLDRIKIAAGPTIVTISGTTNAPGPGSGLTTNILQQIATYVYDGSGKVLTVSNALGEKTVTTIDPIGRPIRVETFSASGTSVRVTTTGYSADHNSVTVTNGTGTNAIVTTTYTDTGGNPVLTIGYPTNGVIEYAFEQYDAAGNPVLQEQLSSSGGTITTWATNAWTYDGLNRVATETTKDGAVTTYSYDALGDVTNRAMPGGLTWSASYLSDGRMASEQDHGGSLTVRTNAYTYYPSTSPNAGLLATRLDGRGTLTTNIHYDAFLRMTNLVTQGAAVEQDFERHLEYDAVGNLIEAYDLPLDIDFGSQAAFSRTYDAYNHVTYEGTDVSTFDSDSSWSTYQGWDSAGRRTSLLTGIGINYGYQADGLMTQAGGSTFSYANNGLIASRTTGAKTVTINQRDGRGRVLESTTTLNTLTILTENLSYRNDGRVSGYTASRDFTDTRNYGYSSLANRVTQESFGLSSGHSATNAYTIDNNVTGGLGILTSAVESGSMSASLTVPGSGGLDGLSRVAQEQDSLVRRSAIGTATGAATVSATLDGNPLDVQYNGDVNIGGFNSDGVWRVDMDLSPGAHTLNVSAVDPTGYIFGSTNSTFYAATNAGDNIQNTYDGNGNITTRVWVNALGQTNRTQALTWDAFNRLVVVTQRDTNGNGFNWVAAYDPIGRRAQTACDMVLTNTVVTGPSVTDSTINSWYDPQVEFEEVGVQVDGLGYWKTLGPDVNGVYGGMQGVGGLENVNEDGHTSATGVVQDFFGNVIGTITEGTLSWNPSRFTSYGPVPGYQSPALSPEVGLAQSLGWRGKRVDETGLIDLGARHYDSVAGRFLNADPLGHSASMDLYSFCQGDPVNMFDPDGDQVIWAQGPTHRTPTPFQLFFPATAAAMGARPWSGSLQGDIQYSRGAFAPFYIGAAVIQSPRVQGGLKVIGGSGEIVVGGTGVVAGSPTVAGSIVSGAAVLHGADTLQSGIQEFWTGQYTQSYTAQGITYFTGNQTAGEVGDAVLGIGLSLGSGLLTQGPTQAGRVTQLFNPALGDFGPDSTYALSSPVTIGGQLFDGASGVQTWVAPGAASDLNWFQRMMTGVGSRTSFVEFDATADELANGGGVKQFYSPWQQVMDGTVDLSGRNPVWGVLGPNYGQAGFFGQLGADAGQATGIILSKH
jgi:RHS repeat-associated protein